MPRTGPCQPFITGDDVANSPAIQYLINQFNSKAAKSNPVGEPLSSEFIAMVCAESAAAASEILYARTAKRFTGNCGPVTIRPVSRPVNAVSSGSMFAGGWSYGWGSSLINNLGEPPVVSLYADDFASVIQLYDFPVNAITEVKIDGTVIPTDEYELREFKYLVRMLPTANAQPTVRWGWPTSQRQDLPDTELNTFSVTYTFGQDPGSGGRIACRALAENLALPCFGDANAYPERLTTISRQGVTAQFANVIDIMTTGGTGIRTVDLWIKSVNPNNRMKKPLVFSPDVARNQRQRNPS